MPLLREVFPAMRGNAVLGSYGGNRLPEIGARTALAEVLRLLGHAPPHEATAFDHHFANRRLHRDQLLLTGAGPPDSLYLVLSGSFRSVLYAVDGSQQVVGFPMRGDLIGLDAIGSGSYPVTVSALEEGHVVVIPHLDMIGPTPSCAALTRAVFAASSAELLGTYEALRAIGALGAEARVAHFLQVMGQRMARFGFSARAFRLTMTRADIASYLGLSIETVSRAFTSLAARRLISVDRQQVRILDWARLSNPAEFEPRSVGQRKELPWRSRMRLLC